MKKSFIRTIFLLLIFTPSIIFSQVLQTGNIRGKIVDNEGMPLPGVVVTATSPSLIGSITSVSDENGLYRIPRVPPGVYTIKFELPGFNTVVRKGIKVRVGITIKVNVIMEQSTLAEEVTVVASSPMIDVQSSKIESTFTTDVMMNLPLNRSLFQVMELVPGVTSNLRIIHGGTAISGMDNIDGINSTDPDLQDPGTMVEFEAMEEVEVVTGRLPAEVGHTAGSFVNVVTKSGGNEFHGMVQTY